MGKQSIGYVWIKMHKYNGRGRRGCRLVGIVIHRSPSILTAVTHVAGEHQPGDRYTPGQAVQAAVQDAHGSVILVIGSGKIVVVRDAEHHGANDGQGSDPPQHHLPLGREGGRVL